MENVGLELFKRGYEYSAFRDTLRVRAANIGFLQKYVDCWKEMRAKNEVCSIGALSIPVPERLKIRHQLALKLTETAKGRFLCLALSTTRKELWFEFIVM
ncbi:hypothetical protein L596_023556 [Steinernema carpocapsae]|uniref:Uncharacterized protein n=1 Tax=Steinernema carpocapsae TaxID=34508 RepID=A0A4U5ME04_STECR|nr:hypothetical protein L596_023556 [Steinernema carpocapsae]